MVLLGKMLEEFSDILQCMPLLFISLEKSVKVTTAVLHYLYVTVKQKLALLTKITKSVKTTCTHSSELR